MHVRLLITTTALLGSVGCSPSWAADPATIDWNSVPVTSMMLFYPGQSTYQWLRGPGHAGAAMVRQGGACLTCHKGQEADLGNKLVKPNSLEPAAPEGKNGALPLAFQVAYDSGFAYFRLQWKTRNPYPGEAYPAYRYDGKEWKLHGGPRLAGAVRKGEQPAIYEDRVSMMIDDGGVPAFAEQGCWLSCHNGQRDAPKQPTGAEVAANPLYRAIKRDDVRKYLPSTRTDADASWDKGKGVDEIAKLMAAGEFLDLIQWRAHRSNPLGMADDGFVLEWRNFDAGKNLWASNLDSGTKQPKYMYDQAKVGKRALTIDDIRRMDTVLIREQNAVPFDPNAGWKEGDLLPQYVVSRADASGSAADNKQAQGIWKDGMWTVVWARPLNLANPDDKALKPGSVYNFSFAVHDDNITTRGHHVSFPVKVGIGAKADIEATRLR